QVTERLFKMMQGKPTQPELPGKELPLEDVELIGEKVNYKIALNPEIFYRYSIFKAKAAARAQSAL
ncbi:hypothetical protein MUP00_05985, partial [Candidatus Bathyarchaeota archaeon]|nr:hypothetical protein [Candidatus Bathyarchaeota archaeon]